MTCDQCHERDAEVTAGARRLCRVCAPCGVAPKPAPKPPCDPACRRQLAPELWNGAWVAFADCDDCPSFPPDGFMRCDNPNHAAEQATTSAGPMCSRCHGSGILMNPAEAN